jgi:hypothetical protein
MGLYLLSYFPYAEGEEYVRSVRADGGWSAVNALYRSPPGSTEHVIHREGESHDTVSVTDRSASDWTRVGPTSDAGVVDGVVMGEADVATMFAATLYDDRDGALVTRDEFLQDGPVPIDYGLPPSDGWAGDRFHAYRSDDDTAYVWRIEFDTTAHAREFASAYRDLLTYHNATSEGGGVYVVDDGPYADAFRVTRDDTTVTIVNAPTTSDLDDVHDPERTGRLADVHDPERTGRLADVHDPERTGRLADGPGHEHDWLVDGPRTPALTHASA